MRRLVLTAAAAAIAAGCGTTRIELKPTRVLHGHVDAQPQVATRSLHAFTACDAFLFLTHGRLLETRDGGRTWQRVAVRALGTPTFLTRTHWLASRRARLYEARDGGRTWTFARTLVRPLRAANFVTQTFAYACGTECFLSNDGGRSVKRVALPSSSMCKNEFAVSLAVAFADPEHGLALCGGQPGAGSQLKQAWSFDGIGWRRLPDPSASGYVGKLDVIAAPSSYAHHSGRVGDLITTDGGRTWRLALLSDAISGDWITARAGWVLDRLGNVSRTSDGGKTWRQVVPGFWPNGDAIFCDPLHGFASDTPPFSISASPPTALYSTADGGLHWSRLRKSAQPLDCLGRHVFVTQFRGLRLLLLDSADGGRTWKRVNLPRSASVPISFISPKEFFAACGGAICATDDAGATFRTLHRFHALNTFAFATPHVGFAAVSIGARKAITTVLERTADAGKTWRLVPVLIAGFRPATVAASAGEAWIFGPRCSPNRESCAPTLVRSEDLGRHWEEIELDRFVDNPPHFDSRTLGVAPGYRGVWITRDGGVTWRWRSAGARYPY